MAARMTSPEQHRGDRGPLLLTQHLPPAQAGTDGHVLEIAVGCARYRWGVDDGHQRILGSMRR